MILGAHGAEVESLGNVKDLMFGADLSSLERIWDTVEDRVDSVGERREKARELRRLFAERKDQARR